ncbi:MAG: hypothetical protein KJ692_11460 [Verrucomicrobia bacterium]|nr:hypothetical protein [Verrucomicrobiota bacterium]
MKGYLPSVCVVVLGCVLGASAGDPSLVNLDIQRAKSLAVDAIRTKYPETDLPALQYAGLTAGISTNNQISITVNYQLMGSNSFEYVVQMDALGHIGTVSKGFYIGRRSIHQKSAANRLAGTDP